MSEESSRFVSNKFSSYSSSKTNDDQKKNKRQKYERIRAACDIENPRFKIGVIYINAEEFITAVRSHRKIWGKKDKVFKE